MTVLGAIFAPDVPPEQLREVALAADRGGLAQLWVWEDCFKESGIATTAAVLAWTERLAVGIGLLPVPLRNVGIAAMEIATLERLFPGRLVPGVGHGVLEWMGQVGARADSPMTLLREHTSALRRLLHGERLTISGRYVHLDDVALDWPPSPPPPLLVGAVGPRTLQLAGELGDGVILVGETTPEQVRSSLADVDAGRRTAERSGRGDVVVFLDAEGPQDAGALAERVEALREAGATHVPVRLFGEGPPVAERVAWLAAEVAPRLSGS